VEWAVLERRLRRNRVARLGAAAERRDAAAAEARAVQKAAALAMAFDPEDEDPDDSHYEGFGENIHYLSD
jgi:hypothetical protein